MACLTVELREMFAIPRYFQFFLRSGFRTFTELLAGDMTSI